MQHAHAAENLLPFLKPGARVLAVGSGSGYLCAVLYRMLQDEADQRSEESKVVGIDHIPELVEWSLENLRQDGLVDAIEHGRIKMVAGDGRKGESSVWRDLRSRRRCTITYDALYEAPHGCGR